MRYRVLITTTSGMVRAVSNSVDLVQAHDFARFMRSRGHATQVRRDSTELTDLHEMLAVRQSQTMLPVSIGKPSPAVRLSRSIESLEPASN